MQHESLSESQFKLLRPVDHTLLKVGDLVYSRSGNLFQVAATPGPDGDVATRNHVGNICMHRACWLKLAPLFWLEDKPVYPGDKLYWADHTTWGSLEVSNTCPDWVIGTTARGGIRIRERFLSWNEVRWLEDQLLCIGDTVYRKGYTTPLKVHNFTGDCVYTGPNDWINLKSLTREKPEVETLVEGQPVVKGETLYHKPSGIQGVVVGWSDSHVQIDTGRGTVSYIPDVLTRNDPTILFEVEGKPVRKGDKLYSKFDRHYTLAQCERIISGAGRYEGSYAVGDEDNYGEIKYLTWEPPLCQVEGKLVFKGDKLYSTVCHSYGDLREIVGVHESGVYSTPDCTYKGEISTLTWDAPEIKLSTGVIVHPGTKVWRMGTGECWEVVSYNEHLGTLFVRQGYSTFTNLKPSSVKLSAPLFNLEGTPVFEGDKVWTLGGDAVIVKDITPDSEVITTPNEWSCCCCFSIEWLSATPISRIRVEGKDVEHGEVLYFRDSGKPFTVCRQIRDLLEGMDRKMACPSSLTRNDPTLVEVTVWVNCYDDNSLGRPRLTHGNYPLVGSLICELEGTIKVPKHIADKLKR